MADNTLSLRDELFKPEMDSGLDIQQPRFNFNKLKVLSSDKQFGQFGADENPELIAKLVASYGSLYVYDHENKPFSVNDLMKEYKGVLIKLERGCEVREVATTTDFNGSSAEGDRLVARFKGNLSLVQKEEFIKAYKEYEGDGNSRVNKGSLTLDVAANNTLAKKAGLSITNQISMILAPESFEDTQEMLAEGITPFVRIVVQGGSWESWFAMPNRLNKRIRESKEYPTVPFNQCKAPWFTFIIGSEKYQTDFGTNYRFTFDAEMTNPDTAMQYLAYYEEAKAFSNYDWTWDAESIAMLEAVNSVALPGVIAPIKLVAHEPEAIAERSEDHVGMVEQVEEAITEDVDDVITEDDLPF